MYRHRFDVGTMLRVFELNVKNPAFAQQKNRLNAKELQKCASLFYHNCKQMFVAAKPYFELMKWQQMRG